MVLGKLDKHIKKTYTNCVFILYYTQKSTQDLNVRPKTLEENIRGKLLDVGLGDDFLQLTPVANATKVKIIKWNHIKLKGFCKENVSNNTMKRQPT